MHSLFGEPGKRLHSSLPTYPHLDNMLEIPCPQERIYIVHSSIHDYLDDI